MDRGRNRTRTISWRQAWLGLAVYAALSVADYLLTVTALTTGHAGLSPTGPYEANPVAVGRDVAAKVFWYKALAVTVGYVLLLAFRPMWPDPWVRRVTLAVLGAGIVLEIVVVCSVIYVLLGA